MSTYGISSLLDEYCAGTRAWMYEAVFTWLDSTQQAAAAEEEEEEDGGGGGSSEQGGSRMFALFAEAGMGKSVFSAAMRTKLGVRANKDSSVIMVGGWAVCLSVGWLFGWLFGLFVCFSLVDKSTKLGVRPNKDSSVVMGMGGGRSWPIFFFSSNICYKPLSNLEVSRARPNKEPSG